MPSPERQLEDELVGKLLDLKYEHRSDIRDRATLESNFRDKFQSLNHVKLTDGEFQRLLDEIVTTDVFTAAHTLRNRNSFTRDDGTPLNYTLVNISDWCKNSFEVVSQLRINTDNSHHRYDVILLINGVPVVQIELKTLGINPRRAIEQIVDYKNDPGNGYSRTLRSHNGIVRRHNENVPRQNGIVHPHHENVKFRRRTGCFRYAEEGFRYAAARFRDASVHGRRKSVEGNGLCCISDHPCACLRCRTPSGNAGFASGTRGHYGRHRKRRARVKALGVARENALLAEIVYPS